MINQNYNIITFTIGFLLLTTFTNCTKSNWFLPTHLALSTNITWLKFPMQFPIGKNYRGTMTAIDLVLHHLLQASNEWRLVETTNFVGRAQYKFSLKLREKISKINSGNSEKKMKSSSEELQDISNKMQRSSHQNLHYSINFRIKKKGIHEPSRVGIPMGFYYPQSQ